ncbi:MAG: hypothetical protein IPP08_04785 [Chlorobiota bacterium]|jgi:hypothetical protein|nr:MAG: hypothetical protein IPP08_04785 [Chlorobiota bacterium]
MDKYIYFSLAIFSILVVSCNKETISEPLVSTNLTFNFNAFIGSSPLVYNVEGMSVNNVPYKVSKFRFYLSKPRLLNENGDTLMLTFLDSGSVALKNNVHLVDFELPYSQQIRFKVLPIKYKGIIFNIGVPNELNHVNASVMDFPLNTDADMYWAWNPGYIFMKLEGKSVVNGKYSPFLYHAGNDDDYLSFPINEAFTVGSNGSTFKINVDINKFFYNKTYNNYPDLGDTLYRFANGGYPTNYMMRHGVLNNLLSF